MVSHITVMQTTLNHTRLSHHRLQWSQLFHTDEEETPVSTKSLLVWTLSNPGRSVLKGHITLLLIALHWLPMLPTNACLWVTSGLNHTGSCSLLATVFLQGMSGIAIFAHKAVTVQTVLVCGALTEGQVTKCHQGRGVPLYLQESLENSAHLFQDHLLS